ncbi:uncharacterized protein LOC106875577 [Octopus bimaculoides]|nr:uncharacterized protein LOC106875577 [Octopus bimaculoides]
MLYSLCQDDITVSLLLLQSHMCPHLIAEFVNVDDHDLLEAYLSLFCILIKLESGLDELKREKPIHSILQIIEDRKCSKCVHICLQVCKNLSEQSRKSKTLLLELNIVPILMSFKEALANVAAVAAVGTSASTAAADNDDSGSHHIDDDDGSGGGGGGGAAGSCYDADSLRLCEELLENLTVRVTPCLDVQQQPSSDGLLLTTSDTNNSSPAIYWCQNKFRLLVTAEMDHAEDFTADFEETAIHIRPVVNNEPVSATYGLYDKVVISKCFMRHKPNKIQMSLAKSDPAYWPRLLETTEKFPNIHKDFGRFEMDFDDDDDNKAFEEEEVIPDDDNPFTLKVKVQVSKIPEISQTILPDYENSDSESSLDIDRIDDYDRFNIYDVKY